MLVRVRTRYFLVVNSIPERFLDITRFDVSLAFERALVVVDDSFHRDGLIMFNNAY